MSIKSLREFYGAHDGKVSDKWEIYLDVYEEIFAPYRDSPIGLLEIGVQNGGSLEIWSKYFAAAAKIVGCDVNPDCARLQYDEPNISVVIGDANADAVRREILAQRSAYDIIIDDGSHRSSDIVRSFATYFPHLNHGGLYVAEDLHCSYWAEFEGELFHPFSSLSFFKRLADIINIEHWREKHTRRSFLDGFFETYGAALDEDVLSTVHSVEIFNSICVIRRLPPARNVLGLRVIAGRQEAVCPQLLALQASHLQEHPPEELVPRYEDPVLVERELRRMVHQHAQQAHELMVRDQQIAERDREITERNQQIAERDRELAKRIHEADKRDQEFGKYMQEVDKRDEELGKRDQELGKRDRRIVRLTHLLTKHQGQLSNSAAELAALQVALQVGIAGKNQVVQERNDLLRQCNDLRHQRNQLLHRLNDVQTRASWQLSRLFQSAEYRWPQLLRGLAAVPKLAWWTLTLQLPGRLKLRRQADEVIASGLFDPRWYVEHNLDIVLNGLSPVYHWLVEGWREGRNPGPTFDTQRYLADHPAVRDAGTNPLLHYLYVGKASGAVIHPPQDDDVVAALSSEMMAGVAAPALLEDQKHLPAYNWARYLADNPDVGASGLDPQLHYALYGRAEGRTVHLLGAEQSARARLADMLPSGAAQAPLNSAFPGSLAVIIPVYRGYEETRRCVLCALTARALIDYRVILVNDCSPDPAVVAFLSTLRGRKGVTVLDNDENLGFTHSVNRGIELAGSSDVVLLNSDTEVAPGWADRLAAQAYADVVIATVTPFSNNATICSYPDMHGRPQLPIGESTVTLDRAFATANVGRALEIPTAVGFCMYIKRECLDEIGLFDVEAFGKGYGEENDFCMRALAAGWKHILAADVFVFHQGEVSFGNSAAATKEHNLAVLLRRYPLYLSMVTEFAMADRPWGFRVAATAARYQLSEKPVYLMVTHSWGGGTERHVQAVIAQCAHKAKFLILRSVVADEAGSDLLLESGSEPGVLQVPLSSRSVDFVVALLKSFRVTRIHIHQLPGFSDAIQQIVYRLGVPFDYTVHDYFTLCPRINLMTVDGSYCGEPDAAGCLTCLQTEVPPMGGIPEILSWRLGHAWLYQDAQRVICPSHDVATRLANYYPSARLCVVPHEAAIAATEAIQLPSLGAQDVFRVALLGVLAKHKGLDLVQAAAALANDRRLPLQFIVIGYQDGPGIAGATLTETGPYDDAKLQSLIDEVDPHLILFPARCPETFSYTLSAALHSRRPLAVVDIGALGERVAGRPWVWKLDPGIDAERLTGRLLEIADELRARRAPSVQADLGAGRGSDCAAAEYYPGEYLRGDATGSGGAGEPLAVVANRLVVIMPEGGLAPSPCSYIRLLVPFSEEQTAGAFQFRIASLDTLLELRPRVVVTNRIALTSPDAVERFLAHCRTCGTRIIYDIDDDLLGLPDTHAEADAYRSHKASVSRLIAAADSVWVSTPALGRKLSALNSNIAVVPNGVKRAWWQRPQSATRGRPQESLRLLYMGTPTHAADFELARAAVSALAKRYPGRVALTVVGVTPERLSDDWCIQLEPPPWARSYPYFVRWLSGQGPFDVGIAPLVQNAFNQCKSPIKVLDYTALGLATVASDCETYRSVIQSGENGLLAAPTFDSWYQHLETCLLDPGATLRMAKCAREGLLDAFDFGAFAQLRNSHLRAAFDGAQAVGCELE